MDVYECIKTRRSIRKFMDADVTMDKIGTIIDAGRFAPCAGNIQNWRFILIKNQGVKEKVAEAAYQQHWIAEAPVVIVVCAVVDKLEQYYGVRGERLYSIQNCSAAIENMILTVHSLGLGSCWVSAFDETMLRRALEIPEDVRPQAILPIGHPDEQVPEPPNYTAEDVTFFEKYDNKVGNFDNVLINFNVVGKAREKVPSLMKKFSSRTKKAFDELKSKRKKK